MQLISSKRTFRISILFFFNATFLPKTASSNRFFCVFSLLLVPSAQVCTSRPALLSVVFQSSVFFSLVWFLFSFLVLIPFYFSIKSSIFLTLITLSLTFFRSHPPPSFYAFSSNSLGLLLKVILLFVWRNKFRCTLYKKSVCVLNILMVYCLIWSTFSFNNPKYLNPFKSITA